MSKYLVFSVLVVLSGCAGTSFLTVHQASEDNISLRHSGYVDMGLMMIEAANVAQNHCAKYEKGAKHNPDAVVLSPYNVIHTFTCTNDFVFVDERREQLPDTVE